MDSPHKASTSAASAGAAALLALGVAIAAPIAGLSPSGAFAAPIGVHAKPAVDAPALFRSRLLWSTIDVCNPSDQPDTVGVRGSMPGDHHARDTMYMRFRLQYLNTSTKVWTDLTDGAPIAFAGVGSGADPRQAGRSFQLSLVAGQPAFTLRGVVSFQWRRGKTVLAQISRPTSAGRNSLAGSDPPGFSAASCLIG
jgi:hypothetical protein